MSRDDTCKRIVLNYKEIPHRTEWVEFPDIAEVAKCIGASHTFLRRGGKPLYTVSILRDLLRTGAFPGRFRSLSI